MPYKDPEKERACGRRRYERITAERLARGMCPRCGKAKPAPDRTLCRHCGEKRRKAERARGARAKAAGILYGGRDPERCREFARDRSRRRDRARRDARTCTRCGTHPPIEGGTVCEPCREVRDYDSYCTSLFRWRVSSGTGCRRESHRPGCLVGGGSGISTKYSGLSL